MKGFSMQTTNIPTMRLLAAVLITMVTVGVCAAQPRGRMDAALATTAPQLDGVIDVGEWPLDKKVPIEHGYFVLTNDRHRLYILLNMTGDTGNDEDLAGDTIELRFNVSSGDTPNVMRRYRIDPNTGSLRLEEQTATGQWAVFKPNNRSARAKGFGAFFADQSRTASDDATASTASPHRVWELAINLDEISAAPGGEIDMALRARSAKPLIDAHYPVPAKETNLDFATVKLNSFSVFPVIKGDVTLDSNPIEITQAVQTRNNSMPLVQNKDTVARVYVTATSSLSLPIRKTVTVELHGLRNGAALPGSPLVQDFAAPRIIDRANINDTANFELPGTWPQDEIDLHAQVYDAHGNSDSSLFYRFNFTCKATPTYWVIPLNTGTKLAPVLIAQSEIDAQESYIESVFPVANIDWVQQPWTVIGPTTTDDSLDDLDDYYLSTRAQNLVGGGLA